MIRDKQLPEQVELQPELKHLLETVLVLFGIFELQDFIGYRIAVARPGLHFPLWRGFLEALPLILTCLVFAWAGWRIRKQLLSVWAVLGCAWITVTQTRGVNVRGGTFDFWMDPAERWQVPLFTSAFLGSLLGLTGSIVFPLVVPPARNWTTFAVIVGSVSVFLVNTIIAVSVPHLSAFPLSRPFVVGPMLAVSIVGLTWMRLDRRNDRTPTKRSKTAGFTLVELLVSISILLLLMALIFVVSRSAVLASKSTVTTSNLRQIHVAMTLYQSDFGEFPPNNIRWPGLAKYLGGTVPIPPLAPADSIEREDGRYDYRIHAFTGSPPFGRQRECMEIRGSSFPIAHDRLFAEVEAASARKKAEFFYVRLDGSIGRVDAIAFSRRLFFDPMSLPCPRLGSPYNFP